MLNSTLARFSLFALALTPLSAFALPGEARSVIIHCGQPTSDQEDISPVTGLTQRNLTYNNIILHFQPMQNGWSFTTAWRGHLPLTRNETEAAMPCFRDAVTQVAAAPQPVIDPTIAADEATLPLGIHFGPAFLWLLLALGIILVIFLAIPRNRQRRRKFLPMESRPFRRPQVFGIPFRRKPQAPSQHVPRRSHLESSTILLVGRS